MGLRAALRRAYELWSMNSGEGMLDRSEAAVFNSVALAALLATGYFLVSNGLAVARALMQHAGEDGDVGSSL